MESNNLLVTTAGNLQKKAAFAEISVLMESPLYWTMNLKERLALFYRVQMQEGNEDFSFRQRVLAWIRTGAL